MKTPDLDLLAVNTETPAVIDSGAELQKLSGQSLLTAAETKTTVAAEILNLAGGSGQAAALNPKLQTLFNQESELKSGSYKVLDFQITEGRLLLTLQSSESRAHPIELVIPTEMLSQSSENVRQGGGMIPGFQGRLPLRSVSEKAGVSTSKIEKLFADLDLKSLEISKVSNNNTAKPAHEKIQIKIVTENSSGELVIRANLSKEQLNVKSADKQNSALSSKSDSGSVVKAATDQNKGAGSHTESNTDHQENSASQKTVQRAAVPIKNSPWVRQFNLADKLQSPETVQQFSEPKTITGSQPIDINMSENFSDNRSLQSSVRISLPENTAGLLKPNGKSIMIRIEPDHLGPVRLNLVIRGDALTARVTVDTVQAQAAIENSVDKLTEQLSRAGIKVEHVEVNLSGEDMRRQFMDRRTSWHRPGRSQPMNDGDDRQIEELSSTIIPTPRSTVYLSSESVNLYA
jgi:flagellar hook-length control protein FliK